MNRSIIAVLGLFIWVVGVCGGVAAKPLPPGWHTESKSAGGVNVLSVGLLPDDGGLLVHGTVQRTLDYFDTPFRHLDLEVIGPTGELQLRRAIRFFPTPFRQHDLRQGALHPPFKTPARRHGRAMMTTLQAYD